jgi:hypothetical protein
MNVITKLNDKRKRDIVGIDFAAHCILSSCHVLPIEVELLVVKI